MLETYRRLLKKKKNRSTRSKSSRKRIRASKTEAGLQMTTGTFHLERVSALTANSFPLLGRVFNERVIHARRAFRNFPALLACLLLPDDSRPGAQTLAHTPGLRSRRAAAQKVKVAAKQKKPDAYACVPDSGALGHEKDRKRERSDERQLVLHRQPNTLKSRRILSAHGRRL